MFTHKDVQIECSDVNNPISTLDQKEVNIDIRVVSDKNTDTMVHNRITLNEQGQIIKINDIEVTALLHGI